MRTTKEERIAVCSDRKKPIKRAFVKKLCFEIDLLYAEIASMEKLFNEVIEQRNLLLKTQAQK